MTPMRAAVNEFHLGEEAILDTVDGIGRVLEQIGRTKELPKVDGWDLLRKAKEEGDENDRKMDELVKLADDLTADSEEAKEILRDVARYLESLEDELLDVFWRMRKFKHGLNDRIKEEK